MPTNNIKLFDENKTNMITDVDYNTSIQRLNGVQTGVASSQLQNKTLYQTSLIAYAIAQFMNEMGFDASDANAVSTFVNNLSSSIKKPSDGAVKYIVQSLTTSQQDQARENIDAANKDTQNKVLALSALPSAVTVSAENLRSYMLSLPRMLTEKLTINVTGTTTDLILIEGFYGPGSIEIAGTAGSTNLNGGVLVLGCAVTVKIHHCNIRPSSDGTSRCVQVQNSSGCVWLMQCQLIGNGSSRGFDSSYSATAHLEYVVLTNHQIAVLAGQSSVISVAVSDETQPSGNSIGAYVWWGGIILLAAKAPELLGGTSNMKSGGIIAKADGTLL